jgi:hypothetical protein
MKFSFLIILILPLLCFCQSSRSAQTSSLQDLKIGKSQAGVKAQISEMQQIGEDWQLVLEVEQSRQGGSSAPIIPVGRVVTAKIAELTMRKLDQLRSTNLSSELEKATTCLAVVGSKNRQTDIYEIYDLILIKE